MSTTTGTGVAAANRELRAQAARLAAAGGPQTDLEEFTGTAPEQAAREAEAGAGAAEHLRSLVERIETLNDQIKALQGDVRDLFVEGKAAGFGPKALRALIRERAVRAKGADEADEHAALRDLYRRAARG
jgi:uncharacterized protein (UPF0335 family)